MNGAQKLWISLAIITFTILMSWLTALRYIPLRAEVSEMIAVEAPYVEDRKLVAHALEELGEATKDNTKAITSLSREQYKTNALLDQLIRSIEAQ